jgi:parallel beta-helix repeat protein
LAINGTLDNPTTEGASVYIQADGVVVSNSRIMSSEGTADTGIITTGGLNGVSISGNTITGFDRYGIFLNPAEGAEGAEVTGNTFNGNRYGVMYNNDGASTISDNTFSNSSEADIGAWFTGGETASVGAVVDGNTHDGNVDPVRVISTSGNEVTGTSGNDSFVTFPEGDVADDIFYGGEGDDRIEAGLGVDVVYGGDGNDFLVGNGGNDELHGGTGNDTLVGRGGADELYGEAGVDTFIFNSDTSGHDTIFDYEDGEVIELTSDFWGTYTSDVVSGDTVITSEDGLKSVTLEDYTGAFNVVIVGAPAEELA